MPRDSKEIFYKTNQALRNAEQGLRDLCGNDRNRKLTGFRNLVVFGRAVTSILQTLRSIDVDKFNKWYLPKQQTMRDDPLLLYFYKLRSEILKEGMSAHTIEANINYLNTNDLSEIQANPPEGAISFFMGDDSGGIGWEVKRSDGTIEKQYIELPPSVDMTITLYFPDAPTIHLGKNIEDRSMENLGKLYFEYISTLFKDAERNFLSE